MAAQRPMSSFLQASKRLKINGESKVVIATGTNPRFKTPIANHDNSLVHKGSSSKSFQEMRIGSKRISSKQSQSTTVKSNPALPTEQSCVRHESAGERAGDWSQEETLQIEIAKVAMHATNNRSICEERVDEAQAQGRPFPDIRDLLVDQSWKDVLQGELDKEYMMALTKFVSQEASGLLPIYPPPAVVFNAFNSCPFEAVKVVILGQDPYHGPGQAMGLSFSVPAGNKVPSSLVNIYKEIRADLGCAIPSHGNLEKWAYQGVLLLNAVLTVRERQANSHARKGWEAFTDAAIRAVSQQRTAVVFLLWGNSAQEKIRLIDTTKHHILKAAHPSGFSAHKGFFGCRHFSQANDLLMQAGHLPIDWQL